MQFNPKIWNVLVFAWRQSSFPGFEFNALKLTEEALHEYAAACDGRAVFDAGASSWEFKPNPKSSPY